MEDAAVDRDGRLIVPCIGMFEEAPSLATKECLRTVLAGMRDSAFVRGVVLVHDRERECGPHALATLEGLFSVGRLFEQLGERAPSPDFPDFDPKAIRAVCEKCAFRPVTMFAALRERLLGDPIGFVEALKALVLSLEGYHETGCRSCTTATAQDLSIVIDELRKGVQS